MWAGWSWWSRLRRPDLDDAPATGAAAERALRAAVPPTLPPPGPELLVALDIDGTLIDLDEHLRPEMARAVADLRTTGAHVLLATGRSVAATLPILRRLDMTHGWAVCSNGGVVIRLDPRLPQGWEMSDVVTFDPARVLRLLREELPEALFAVEDAGLGVRVSGEFPTGELAGEAELVSFTELCEVPATRVIMRAPHLSSQDFHALVDRVGLHGVSYAVGWSAWLDIAPDGISKASALDMLRLRLGVAADATVAIGDGRNDIEMLQWAALGVAMGRADADTRAAADAVTATVQDDGAVALIRALLDRDAG